MTERTYTESEVRELMLTLWSRLGKRVDVGTLEYKGREMAVNFMLRDHAPTSEATTHILPFGSGLVWRLATGALNQPRFLHGQEGGAYA